MAEMAQDTLAQGPHLPFRKWQWWQEGFLRVATHFHLRGRNGTVKPPIHPKNVFVAEVDGFNPIFHYKTDTWQEWHHFLPHKNMVAEVDTFKPKFHYKTVLWQEWHIFCVQNNMVAEVDEYNPKCVATKSTPGHCRGSPSMAGDTFPDDLIIDYNGSKHLFINSLRGSPLPAQN
ncbi:hypothetical protein R3P38DRAFT_2776823 [Favolaschia claudopus]|uniref:Uncharacterized protein n=1 Tax=Favolaschia claudopus TaxID=2862362 RepID=A0AAW0BNU6_9AGAR